jgi:ferredoxin
MKVRIDRNDCISCGTCWNTCPEFFEQNPVDTFSQIIDEYRIGNNPAEGDAPEELGKMVRRSSELCPVQIIRVS